MKKFISALIMALMMVGGVFATVTPTNPVGDDTTNANTYDFTAVSTNPFALGGLHINLGFGGILNIPCTNNPPNYNCDLLGVDISGLEGSYLITMEDVDLPVVTIGNLIIDHSVVANNFNFQATGNLAGYEVVYSINCVDIISGVDPINSKAVYSKDGWVTTNNMPASPADMTALGAGTVEFKGVCQDNAGNTAETAVTTINLPKIPPNVIQVDRIDVSPITNTCTNAVAPFCDTTTTTMDGSGTAINNAMIQLTFRNPVDITDIRINGVSTGGTSTTTSDIHVLMFQQLTTGNYVVEVDSAEGTEIGTHTVNLDINNANAGGSATVDVISTLPVTPATIAINGAPTVYGSPVLPGGVVYLGYDLTLTGAEYIRATFNEIGGPAFGSPITMYCVENSNPITHEPTGLTTTLGTNWALSEANPAIDCNANNDVIIRIPILLTASSGLHSANIEFGLYVTP